LPPFLVVPRLCGPAVSRTECSWHWQGDDADKSTKTLRGLAPPYLSDDWLAVADINQLPITVILGRSHVRFIGMCGIPASEKYRGTKIDRSNTVE